MITTWALRKPVVAFDTELPRAAVGESLRNANDSIWSDRIDDLLGIRQMEDDWDGQGAPAPTSEVVDSALVLALLLKKEGIAPPKLVTQGPSGGVHFDWLPGGGKYIELRVLRPYQAEMIVHIPGLPTRLVTIFTDCREVSS